MNEVLADLTGAFYGLLIWPSLNFLFKFWPRHWKKNFQMSESTYSNRKLQRSMFWGERKVPVKIRSKLDEMTLRLEEMEVRMKKNRDEKRENIKNVQHHQARAN